MFAPEETTNLGKMAEGINALSEGEEWDEELMDKKIDAAPGSGTGRQKHPTEFASSDVPSKNVDSAKNSSGPISFDGTVKKSSVFKHDSAASQNSRKTILSGVEGNPPMQLISAADLMAKGTRTGSVVAVGDDPTSMELSEALRMEKMSCISKMLNPESPTKGHKVRSNSNDHRHSRPPTAEVEVSSFFVGRQRNKLPSSEKRKEPQMSMNSGEVRIFSPQDKPGIEREEQATMNSLDIRRSEANDGVIKMMT